jgi:hypothetical protein
MEHRGQLRGCIRCAPGRDKRSGFDQLHREAAVGKFDVEMSWAIDRFGRRISSQVATAVELWSKTLRKPH